MFIVIYLMPALALLIILDGIREPFIKKETKKLLSQYYSSDPELNLFFNKFIETYSQYYETIFQKNEIYKRIFIAEALMAYSITTISLYKFKYNSEISISLIKGIKDIVIKKISILIPTISTQYIESCYISREKQYKIFFQNVINRLFLTENKINKLYHRIFFMTILNTKIFYDKDISYFEHTPNAIPLINEKIFNNIDFSTIDIKTENKNFLKMTYSIYTDCNSLTEKLNNLLKEENILSKKLRKII